MILSKLFCLSAKKFGGEPFKAPEKLRFCLIEVDHVFQSDFFLSHGTEESRREPFIVAEN